MELGLKGKVAFITGGSKGIGFVTALTLVKEGADVAICARNIDRLQTAATAIKKETGRQILTIVADVTIEEDCKKAVEVTVQHFGKINILINNAGTSSANPFDQVDTDLWKYDLDLKLFGAIHCSRYAVPYMRKESGGTIVNLTASMAKTPGASTLPPVSVVQQEWH